MTVVRLEKWNKSSKFPIAFKRVVVDEFVCSLDEIKKVAKFIADSLSGGGILLIKGNLASGKTTFVKEFVKYIGIDENVTSPTFSVMNIYDDRVFHYDIYNKKSSGFLELGLLENLEKKGYHIIEWADEDMENLLDRLGFEYILIDISPNGKDKRVYRIKNA